MPCVCLETSHLKDILNTLPQLPPCNWLITGLECYDYSGWEGCEKWAERKLFLSDMQFRHDVNKRDMDFMWGIFSVIPSEVSIDTVEQYPLPETETPYYMSSKILPQHPLALVEFYVFDGDITFVSSRDAKLLDPLYNLCYSPRNEEESNKQMNAQLRHIQRILREEVPDVSTEAANGVQWKIWHAHFQDKESICSDAELKGHILKEYRKQEKTGFAMRDTVWDPFLQE